MESLRNKLFDICPSWLYRVYGWIRYRPYWIKRWFIRANGNTPDCDCWEFNYTLAIKIEQGLSYMLYHGCSATWCNNGKTELEQRSDLIYIKNVMSDFIRYKTTNTVWTKELCKQHQKDLDKAFALLANYMWGLWD